MFVSTPSAGVLRTATEPKPELCPGCGKPLTRFVAWPQPHRYGCVKRGCALSVVGEGGRVHGRSFSYPIDKQ